MTTVGGTDKSSSTAGSLSNGVSQVSRSETIDSIASSMVAAQTNANTIDTAKLGTALAAVKDNISPSAYADLKAAVEARLSPVQAGELRAAIAAAPSHQNASMPSTQLTPLSPYEAEQVRTAALCGQPYPTLARIGPPQKQLPGTMTTQQFIEHVDRLTGGPLSSLAYNAAYLSGASQETMDKVYSVAVIADGLAGGITDGMAQRDAMREVTPGL